MLQFCNLHSFVFYRTYGSHQKEIQRNHTPGSNHRPASASLRRRSSGVVPRFLGMRNGSIPTAEKAGRRKRDIGVSRQRESGNRVRQVSGCHSSLSGTRTPKRQPVMIPSRQTHRMSKAKLPPILSPPGFPLHGVSRNSVMVLARQIHTSPNVKHVMILARQIHTRPGAPAFSIPSSQRASTLHGVSRPPGFRSTRCQGIAS